MDLEGRELCDAVDTLDGSGRVAFQRHPRKARYARDAAEGQHEAVRDGILSAEEFRLLTFENPARFWTAGNPEFFAGTRVERAVRALA